MADENYADCEGGIFGETRLIRVFGEGISDDLLAELALRTVEHLCSQMIGLPEVTELRQTKLERDAIVAAATALDTVLTGLGLLPRCLTPRLYHLLSAQEFNQHLGAGVTGAIRRGQVYLRRTNSVEGMLTTFLRCLCHETAHLSEATVVEMKHDGDSKYYTGRIRSGLTLIDSKPHFNGLNEAVTDWAGELILTGTREVLGIGGAAADSLPPTFSVYQTHKAVVDGVCRQLYPKSRGADGWTRLLEDYWGGTNRWLNLVKEMWPAAYVTLHEMDETQMSAEFALRFLNLGLQFY